MFEQKQISTEEYFQSCTLCGSSVNESGDGQRYLKKVCLAQAVLTLNTKFKICFLISWDVEEK